MKVEGGKNPVEKLENMIESNSIELVEVKRNVKNMQHFLEIVQKNHELEKRFVASRVLNWTLILVYVAFLIASFMK